MSNIRLIDRFAAGEFPGVDAAESLLATCTRDDRDHAASLAYRVARERFGTKLHAWGVVDLSNCCARDCYYCGLSREHGDVERYRMTTDEVLGCCAEGHRLGFRTFLFQGGEDPELTDDVMVDVIWQVRKKFPDSAIALEFGERSRDTYQRYFDAGADRYLLPHITADAEHFAQLHPRRVTLQHRIRCLEDLKDVGFGVGAGMLVGVPYQTPRTLAHDLAFLVDFAPEYVTVGPFLPAHATRFADAPAGKIDKVLFVLSLVRLLLPDAGLPVLTSVATLHPRGRELAVMAGANIVMPNLTPADIRASFAMYDGRVTAGPEAVEGLQKLTSRMDAIGYTLASDRFDRGSKR